MSEKASGSFYALCRLWQKTEKKKMTKKIFWFNYRNQQQEQTIAKHKTNVVMSPTQVNTRSWCCSARRFSTCFSYIAIRSSRAVNRFSWSSRIIFTPFPQLSWSRKEHSSLQVNAFPVFSFQLSENAFPSQNIAKKTSFSRKYLVNTCST